MTQKRRLRCAIYTRKSTEEGLDMAFNSLDAQREACAAYALSQKSEGWSVLPALYDDGGFSGGSMERPALARLLADLQAGRIDIVIVYKVDRLTRSLNDFARIVDVFDAAGASFVSVTQQFNTTTSMGRLTLNVLLSFAQFEREVIAERVRDKIAQSKAKGMWMGGTVPLGYDVIDRKMVPNAEAATVVHIYQRYLELPSVMALMEELKAQGIYTKSHVSADGSKRGGIPFARGPLHHLLSNPIYIGKVQHRGLLHDGQHLPIVDQPIWDAVQAKRKNAIGDRRARGNSQHASLLTGMIRDHVDRAMSPSHAVKKKRRYRYYVSSMAAVTDGRRVSEPALRLAGTDLEQAVVESVAAMLSDQQSVLNLPQVDARAMTSRLSTASLLADSLAQQGKHEIRQTLLDLALALIVHPDRIDASISRQKLVAILDGSKVQQQDDGWRIPLTIATSPDRRGRNLKLVLGSPPSQQSKVNPELIGLLRRAEAARQRLLQPAGTDAPDREDERLARLAFLSPDIVAAILDGRQPSSLTPRRLLKQVNLPLHWHEQKAALGF
jgi:DNA invertase Pin-like site-specific DNA recombinase